MHRYPSCSLMAANDNYRMDAPPQALESALRFFAEHGLAAADEASKQAQAAAQNKDLARFVHWRDICHALDRRMAHKLDSELAFSA